MPSNQLFAANQPMQTAATTGTGPAVALNHAQRSVVYLKGSAGISAGAVQVETADTPDYAGTWTPESTPVTVTASALFQVDINRPVGAVRTRVTTNFTGGTFSSSVQAYN